MIDAVKFRELVEAWETLKAKADKSKMTLDRLDAIEARDSLYSFLLFHASELLALVEAQANTQKEQTHEP